MLKYHHLGIPTKDKKENETYLEKFQLYVSGFDTSPYGIEWMRFLPGSPLPELVKTVPHIAFEVDDLDKALVGKTILIHPNTPSPGIRVAFIVDNGAPVEFMEIDPEMQLTKSHSNPSTKKS